MTEAVNTDVGQKRPLDSRIRWQVVALLFVAVVINYIDRSSMSVALPEISRELRLDDSVSGLLLGAFFWTYAAFQIPCGRLVDRFGARRVLAVAATSWCLVTAVTGLASDLVWLLGFRLLLGVAQAAVFPAGTSCVEHWFPRDERATASGLYDSGARVGTLLAIPVFSVLVASVGWRLAFGIVGFAGLLWVALWWPAYRDEPAHHPRVSEAELHRIGRPDPAGKCVAASPVTDAVPRSVTAGPGWGVLLRSRTVWGTVVAVVAQSYVIYFFITWFPAYLIDARGFTLLRFGLLGTVPALAAVVGNWLGGWASDYLVRRGRSVTFARKSCGALGLMVSASVGVAAVVPGAGAALALLSLSFAGVSFATSVLLTIPADISPPRSPISGTLQSIQNTFSGVAGIVSPLAIGFLKGATGSFVPGLLSAAFVAVLGALALLFVVDRIDQDVFPDSVKHTGGRGRTGPRWGLRMKRRQPDSDRRL
ncbi:MFS transporter [Streptomyces sp. NPDC007107]|uniref:MFS transporter n=1 Tax=Streptomyces sp. NPDC007107 TaxID=3156915 RepID=UPI00341167F4